MKNDRKHNLLGTLIVHFSKENYFLRNIITNMLNIYYIIYMMYMGIKKKKMEKKGKNEKVLNNDK